MFNGRAFAQERGSLADAKKMVDEALVHVKAVGPEKAFEDFSTPGGKWHYKDIYLFGYNMDGTIVCHGAIKALIGKNLINFRSADGQLLVQNLIEIAKTKGFRLDRLSMAPSGDREARSQAGMGSKNSRL
jgi:signal transduction histidine kinase